MKRWISFVVLAAALGCGSAQEQTTTGPATTEPATTEPGTTGPGTTEPGTTEPPAAS